MNNKTRFITLAATLAALCAVTGLIPYVFFLPVMVAATTVSLGLTAFVGLAFGCISLLYSFVMPMSPVALAFVEAPYLAIVPRIIAAVGAFGVYVLIVRLFKPQKRLGRAAAVGVAAAAGSLLNTGIVVGVMALVAPYLALGEVAIYAYVPTMLVSGAIECACMAVLTPAVSLTLQRTVLRGRKKTEPEPEPAHADGDAPARTGGNTGGAA